MAGISQTTQDKFVSKGPINNIPSLVEIMAWCQPGNKPLFEPMMVSLLIHICVTQPQCVNALRADSIYINASINLVIIVQVMACGLFGTKSLPEPTFACHQLDPLEEISVKS